MKVGFQGTLGSYSQEALYKYFGKKDIEAIGLPLSEDVCLALENEEVASIILPVENSIVGNVDINMDLIYKHNFYAMGEVYLPINHCLLANKGTKLEDIKIVHSHPIALAQCHDFFVKNKIKPVPEFDTAGASKLLSVRDTNHEATIASRLCSDYYGLEIISDSVQKVTKNITRFLVLVLEKDIPNAIKLEKTSIAFSTNHKPGALLECLGIFADFGVNLTKIQSRPIPENPFMYIFYADFLGSINDESIKNCLKSLKEHTSDIKILGSYPRGTI